MIWTQTSGLIALDFFHGKIILHLCNFPFWKRRQVCCIWRDSCGFMGPPLPSTLVYVTHSGPLSRSDKCPHSHVLSKKTLASGKKRKAYFDFTECGMGFEGVSWCSLNTRYTRKGFLEHMYLWKRGYGCNTY